MNISNTKFRIAPLTKDILQVSAKVLAKIFASQNQIWTTMRPSQEELNQFMVGKLGQMLEWEEQARRQGIISENTFINFVYLDKNDEIIGVWANIELSQYLRKKSKISLPLFEKIEKYGHQMERSLENVEVTPGRQVSGMWIAVKKEARQSKKAAFLFMLDVTHMLAAQGFETMYCRCSSKRATSQIQKDGGQVLSQASLEVNGKQHSLYYLKWHQKTILDRKREMERSQERPKL